MQSKDGLERVVNRKEFDRFIDKTKEGYYSIRNLQYNIDETTGFVNVTNFATDVENNPETNSVHDIRKGAVIFRTNPRRVASMKMTF